MNYKQAAREIATGTAKPVYICYGPEQFLMNEFITYTVDRLVEAPYRDFAVSRYDLSETSIEDVLEDAETAAFLAPMKVVIAKDAAFLTSAKESSKVEHRTERLIEYVKSPSPSAMVLLTVSADKLDERKKIVKQLKDADLLIPFTHMGGDELLQWVRKRAERSECTFTPEAAEKLLQTAGTNLQTLAGEIEKCSLYAGKGGTVTPEAVDMLVVRSTEQNVFLLVEDIVKRKTERALTTLAELLKQKEEPIKILMLIASQFRLIAMSKELARSGYSQQQIAGQIGVHPYRVKLAMEQASGYSEERLKQILHAAAELDYGMKTGRQDKTMGLELFILRFAG
ncbi:DNA polymerase III subunit delta [Paenibacillus turpanensis]|uniref:DNA polymerase III subunit delta n=1 Tax=Paenibacillus turpanensis TaxID=2689078 RepID=UPI00140D8857|nr:DNA polymerase III subunit delta [Paenibacillus turpanensis]